jgi:hypothetical protein
MTRVPRGKWSWMMKLRVLHCNALQAARCQDSAKEITRETLKLLNQIPKKPSYKMQTIHMMQADAPKIHNFKGQMLSIDFVQWLVQIGFISWASLVLNSNYKCSFIEDWMRPEPYVFKTCLWYEFEECISCLIGWSGALAPLLPTTFFETMVG